MTPAEASKPKRQRGRPRSFHDQTDSKTIQSLDRALTILARLAADDGAALTELSERAGQSPTTTYRVLSTFQRHEMVEFDEAEQLWYIGPGAFRIGSSFINRSNILQVTRPIMQRLMRLTGETANLGIQRDGKVMFISQAETPKTIRAFFAPGTLSPMHASGIGKALLAQYSSEKIDDFVARHGLPRISDRTITGKQALLDELEKVRALGYAVDDEENTPGMRCVAAPVLNAWGEPVAGMSVSGPSFRMAQHRIPEVGRQVRALASEATRALGGKPAGAAST